VAGNARDDPGTFSLVRHTAGAPTRPDCGQPTGSEDRLSGDAASRAVLAAAGIGAGFVLYGSWATVQAPFDAALTVAIIVGAVHGVAGWVPGLRLPARPGATGCLAYGFIFLAFLLLTPERIGIDANPLLWARLGSGVVAALVVHLIRELLSRPQHARPGWRGLAVVAILPGLVGVGVLAADGLPGKEPVRTDRSVQLAAVAQPPEDIAAALTFPVDGPTAVARTAQPASPTPDAGGSTNTGARALRTNRNGGQAATPTQTPTPTPTLTPGAPAAPTAPNPAPMTVAPIRPTRLLISGESTAGATGGGMRTWGQKNGRAQVEVVGTNGCALQQDGVAYWRDGWAQPQNGACLNLIEYTVQVANQFRPDMIILFIGSNQLSDWLLPGQTVASHIGETAFDQLYLDAATAALRKLASVGIPVLFASLPVPAWDPGIQTGNPDYPGTGPIKMNDAVRTRRLNELTALAVRSVPLAQMALYAERISNPDGTVSASIRPDGVHLRQDVVPAIMDSGLEGDLRASYQQVVRRVPSAALGGAHTWS